MTPDRDEPLNVTVLDIHYAERRDGDEIVPMRATDRAAIRQTREDEWEHVCRHGFGTHPADKYNLTNEQLTTMGLSRFI